MAKKRSWFSFLMRLFISESKSESEKKPKKRRWGFERYKSKQLVAADLDLSEAREEQRKHALTVAIATATAAEAAVAAAHAAAQVVRLTEAASESCKRCVEERRNTAAIKIQAAFRAHLARKALRALKGLVRLQAMVRGRAVRRKAFMTFKCSPFIANVQHRGNKSQISTVEASSRDGGEKELLKSKEEFWGEKEAKLKYCKSLRNWEYGVLSREDMESIWLRKQDAITKQDRMKKYSYSYQERQKAKFPEERTANEAKAGQDSWFDPWTGEREQIQDSIRLRLRNMQKHDPLGLNLPFLQPRRSFSPGKQNSVDEDGSFPSSPAFPPYMAATESTKAKARSMSTPKQRQGSSETWFDSASPCRNRAPIWSTYNGGSPTADGKRCSSRKTSIVGTKNSPLRSKKV